MNYRRLGKAGIKLSELSFGAWVTFGNQLGDEAAQDLMTAAYDAGVNFFDNAEAYASGEAEIIMGKVLSKTDWANSSAASIGSPNPSRTLAEYSRARGLALLPTRRLLAARFARQPPFRAGSRLVYGNANAISTYFQGY